MTQIENKLKSLDIEMLQNVALNLVNKFDDDSELVFETAINIANQKMDDHQFIKFIKK